jgi:ankyrin repeat protein
MPELAKLFLEKGADANAQCECKRLYGGGWTPLTMVVRTRKKGKNSIVNLLLASGADVNLARKDGTTALMLAAKDGDLHFVRILLEKGANVNPQNEKGQTALSNAKDWKHEDVVAALLSGGAAQ